MDGRPSLRPPSTSQATMDFPEGLPIVGRSELVEARVVRLKRKMAGEAHAQARRGPRGGWGDERGRGGKNNIGRE